MCNLISNFSKYIHITFATTLGRNRDWPYDESKENDCREWWSLKTNRANETAPHSLVTMTVLKIYHTLSGLFTLALLGASWIFLCWGDVHFLFVPISRRAEGLHKTSEGSRGETVPPMRVSTWGKCSSRFSTVYSSYVLGHTECSDIQQTDELEEMMVYT